MEKKSEDVLVGTASVELIRENPDGSADYVFNFPPEAMAALTRLGIMTAIQAGIDAAKRLDPDVDASDTSPEHVDETAKQRHEWVGLTIEEKHQLNDILNLQGRFPVIDAIEAKLKEKNCGLTS